MNPAEGRKSPCWIPEANGAIYCSPACGCRCTRKAYDDAHLKANALCTVLGEGWKPVVWENMGWHYSADKDVASMHEGKDSYMLFWNIDSHQIVVSGKHARDTLHAGREAMRKLNAELHKAHDALFGGGR